MTDGSTSTAPQYSDSIGPERPSFVSSEWSLRSTIFGVFGILLAMMLCLMLFGPPVFEGNSDLLMSMISAGVGFVDRPDAHILFSHPLIGHLLTILVGFRADLPWYGIYLLVAQAMAAIVIGGCISFRRSPGVAFALCLVAGMILLMRPALMFQFTTTSMLLSVAGALLTLHAVEKSESGRVPVFSICGALLMFISSSLVRVHCPIIAICFTALALFLRSLSLKRARSKRSILLSALIVAVTLVAAVAVKQSQSAYYAETGWSGYYRTHELISMIFDFRSTQSFRPATIEAWESVDWRPIDVDLARSWYLIDEEKYSRENLQKVLANLPVRPSKLRLANTVESFGKILLDYSVMPMLLILAVSPILVDRQRFSRKAMVAYLCVMIASLVALKCFAKLPPRLYASVFCIGSAISLFYISNELFLWRPHSKFHNSGKVLLAIAIVSLSLFSGYKIKSGHDDLNVRSEELKKGLASLQSSVSGKQDAKVYAVWWSSFPASLVQPLEPVRSYFGELDLIGFNCLERSPITVSRLSEYKLTNLLRECGSGRVRMISQSQYNDLVSDWYSSTLGKRLEFIPIVSNEPASLFVYEPRVLENTDSLRPEFYELGAVDRCLFPPLEGWALMDIEAKGNGGDGHLFAARGEYPTLSCRQKLDVPLSKVRGVCVEMQISKWIAGGRTALAQGFISGPKGERMEQVSIPLSDDGKVHSYLFSVDGSKVMPGEILTSVNILPLYRSTGKEDEQVLIRSVGLALQ